MHAWWGKGMARLPLPSLSDEDATTRDVALDSLRRRLVVAAGEQVISVDLVSGRTLFAVELPGTPTSLAIDAETGMVVAALADIGEIRAIGIDGRVLGIAVGLGRPTGLAAGLGRVFVADSSGERIVVLDPRSWGIMGVKTLPAAPYAMAADPPSERLYVGLMGRGSVLAIDTVRLDRVWEVSLGGLGFPQGLALDEKRGALYVAHALSPRYGALTAIDVVRGEILRTAWGNPDRPLFGSDAVSVDAGRGVVYLGGHAVVTIWAAGDLAVQATLGTEAARWPAAIVIDPVDNALYGAGEQGQLYRWAVPVDADRS